MRLGWKESKWVGQLRVEASNYVHFFIPSLLCARHQGHTSQQAHSLNYLQLAY